MGTGVGDRGVDEEDETATAESFLKELDCEGQDKFRSCRVRVLANTWVHSANIPVPLECLALFRCERGKDKWVCPSPHRACSGAKPQLQMLTVHLVPFRGLQGSGRALTFPAGEELRRHSTYWGVGKVMRHVCNRWH